MSKQAEDLARLFHETYERLAPQFGYATKKETAVPWDSIPADNANKKLMVAVCEEILHTIKLTLETKLEKSKQHDWNIKRSDND